MRFGIVFDCFLFGVFCKAGGLRTGNDRGPKMFLGDHWLRPKWVLVIPGCPQRDS